MNRTRNFLLSISAIMVMNSSAQCQTLDASNAAGVSPNMVASVGGIMIPPLPHVTPSVSTPVSVARPMVIPAHRPDAVKAPQILKTVPLKSNEKQASSGKKQGSNGTKKGSKLSGKKNARVLTKEELAALAKAAAEKKARLEAERAIRIVSSVSYTKKEGSDEKWVALTFDDGPSPDYTVKILALLKQYNIHATFCLVGRQVKKYPELVEQIVAEGHKIALHTMNHDERLAYRSDKKIQQEILGEKELIETVVPDAKIEYFRAPGGVWSRHIRTMVNSWGMKSLGWSVDSKDWTQPGVDSIISTVNAELKPGGVVLMHDAGGNRSETLAALKKLIPQLKKDGYQFGFPGTANEEPTQVALKQ